MFREIYAFELRTAFRRPTTYLYFGILFLLTMLIGMAASEVFDTTRSDSLTIRNSAGAVASILLGTSSSIFGILVSILLIASMATVIQKDYEYNMHPLFFTKPVSKPGYFLGRFLGGFTVAVFIFAGLLAGYWAGSLFGMGKPVMGEYRLVNYLEPFLLFTLPNILFLGVLFFSLTTFLRTTMAAYIVAIVLMVLQIASDSITANIDNKTIAALLEPSGAQALRKVTQYWSPAERNTNLIPLRDEILYTRLIWMGISLLIGAFTPARNASVSWRTSSPVMTAATPGIFSAAEISIPRISACACGDRRIAACNVPFGTARSSANWADPSNNAASSVRGTGCPICV